MNAATDPTATPMTTPPPPSRKKRQIPSPTSVAPVTTAAAATWKSTSDVASLNRLSPCTSVATRGGSGSRRDSADTATGSVLASTAPSTKAASSGTEVSTPWTTYATAKAVTTTSPSASTAIGRHSERSSGMRTCSAAANSSGGMTTSTITVGETCTAGTPGSSPSPNPATTSRLGGGVPTRSAAAVTSTVTRTSATITRVMSTRGLRGQHKAVPTRLPGAPRSSLAALLASYDGLEAGQVVGSVGWTGGSSGSRTSTASRARSGASGGSPRTRSLATSSAGSC